MRNALAFAVSTLLGCAWASAGEGVEAFALAPDERTVAVVTGRPHVLELRETNGTRTLALPMLDAIEVDADPRLAWSADGRYLSVQAAVASESNGALIVDVDRLEVVWERPVSSVAWLEAGHALLVVPDYEINGEQTNAGLIRVDPATGREDPIASEYFFTGDLDVGHSVVVGRDVRKVGEQSIHSIVRVDLGENADALP
jgi:hypothetical protein